MHTSADFDAFNDQHESQHNHDVLDVLCAQRGAGSVGYDVAINDSSLCVLKALRANGHPWDRLGLIARAKTDEIREWLLSQSD
jgi:hypothetical protein